MERKPPGQQHDLQWHHRHRAPGHLAEQRELRAGEDIRPFRPARRQDRLPRAAHVRRVRIVPDRLQREIRLDAGRDVERAIMEQRPAAMRALDAAQINADLRLQRRIDPVEEMFQQHVFRRNRRVRFQFKHPVPVALPPPCQGVGGGGDGVVQGTRGQGGRVQSTRVRRRRCVRRHRRSLSSCRAASSLAGGG